jgi:hypothetical protein
LQRRSANVSRPGHVTPGNGTAIHGSVDFKVFISESAMGTESDSDFSSMVAQ